MGEVSERPRCASRMLLAMVRREILLSVQLGAGVMEREDEHPLINATRLSLLL